MRKQKLSEEQLKNLYYLYFELGYPEALRTLTDSEYVQFKDFSSGGVFHGGCVGCSGRQVLGVERCKGCMYFRCDFKKPNLSIKPFYK